MAKEKFIEQKGESQKHEKKPEIITDYLEKLQKKIEVLEKLMEKETSPEKRKKLEKRKDKIEKEIRESIKKMMEMMDIIEKKESDFEGTEEEKRAMIKEALGLRTKKFK